MSTNRKNSADNSINNKHDKNNLRNIRLIINKLSEDSNMNSDLRDVAGIYQHSGNITLLVRTGFQYDTWRNLRELVNKDYYQYDAKYENTKYTLFAFDFSASEEISLKLNASDMPPLNHDQQVIKP
jgi:hypothetical protein